MTCSRRSLLALSAAVVLVAAACGDDPDPVAGPPVIQLASPAASEELSARPTAGGADAARELSMIAYLEYVLSGELPALDGPAASWVLPGSGAITVEQVRELASVLGVAGDPREQPAEWGGGWIVGPDDGSAPSLGVSGDASGYWWYSPAWADTGAVRCGVAEPMPIEDGAAAAGPDATDLVVDVDVATVEDCVEPTPPQGVPSAEEAEVLMRQLLADLGEDPDQFALETYADDWAASVTAFRLLDGVRSPLAWSASYGGDGVLQYAGGSLADPRRSDDYPRIGTAAGLERLRSGNDPVYGAGAWSAFAVDELAADAPVDAGSDVVGDAIDPAAGMPEPPEPVTVTITGVEEELVQVWDVDGTVHLLPGYAFVSSEGGRYTVSAVPAEFLVPAAPVPVEPVPVDSAPVDSAPVDSVDPVEPAVGPIDDAFVAGLVGMPEAEAVAAIEEAGWVARVLERDGESFPATMDLREDRINLVIAGGVVTEATVG